MNARPDARRRAAPRGQRGAALLTAMVIVTLVVTLAASMVWQQWRAVQVEVAERARAQAAWILSGALDWAVLILREDAKSGRPTALTEPWAFPLAEARLSTFLAADKASGDEDGPEAFLSGAISDAQARINLTNLVVEGNKIDPIQLATLQRLCETVGVETGVADRIATGLRDAMQRTSGTATPLLPRTIDQLIWLGIDAASVEALAPYIVILPVATPINVNTAPREVLAAAIKQLDLGSAERLVQMRQRVPFDAVGKFTAQLPQPEKTEAKLAVKSDYFEVLGRLRMADRVLEERSLVHRVDSRTVNVLRRERVASRETGTS